MALKKSAKPISPATIKRSVSIIFISCCMPNPVPVNLFFEINSYMSCLYWVTGNSSLAS